jgi:predicted CoA-binding protein
MHTLVLGASEKTDRYSNMAIRSLKQHGQQVSAIGNRAGEVAGVAIQTGLPALKDIDTVTLYLSAANQKGYYDYIVSLKPRRVIFNPGAENPELEKRLTENKIEPIEACTLVMLNTGQW